jgi:hypothetical protein
VCVCVCGGGFICSTGILVNIKFYDGMYWIYLTQGCTTCGPPVCVIQPAATFVNYTYVYTVKVAQ